MLLSPSSHYPTVSSLGANLLQQEGTDHRPESLGLLQERIVPAPLEEHQAGIGNASSKFFGTDRRCLRVVASHEHERRDTDFMEVRAVVEAASNLSPLGAWVSRAHPVQERDVSLRSAVTLDPRGPAHHIEHLLLCRQPARKLVDETPQAE